MTPPWAAYAAVFVAAAVTTYLLIPVARRTAARVGAVVLPDERRVHESPTPTLGGAAMLAGFIVAMAIAAVLSDFDAVFATVQDGVPLEDVLAHGRENLAAAAKRVGQVLAMGEAFHAD